MNPLDNHAHRGHPGEVDLYRPTWAEIDLLALAHNLSQIRARLTPGRQLLSVVKANAYGHGVGIIAPALQELGSDWFGVATVAEGLELRQLGINRPILVMGAVHPNSYQHLSRAKLTATAFSLHVLKQMGDSALPLEIQLKLDTGMNRLGLKANELSAAAALLDRYRQLRVNGIFSHLGHADDPDRSIIQNQQQAFGSGAEEHDGQLRRTLLKHISNSGALLMEESELFGMVRIGILLYGSFPSTRSAERLELKPVMRLKSEIIQLKDVAAGERVGYDGLPQPKALRIGVLPIGYADGYHYNYRKFGRVICRDHFCPIVGNICMDMMMIDVSDCPGVEVNSEVVLLGSAGKLSIPALTVSQKVGTASYEIFTSISERVARIAVHGEQPVSTDKTPAR